MLNLWYHQWCQIYCLISVNSSFINIYGVVSPTSNRKRRTWRGALITRTTGAILRIIWNLPFPWQSATLYSSSATSLHMGQIRMPATRPIWKMSTSSISLILKSHKVTAMTTWTSTKGIPISKKSLLMYKGRGLSSPLYIKWLPTQSYIFKSHSISSQVSSSLTKNLDNATIGVVFNKFIDALR